MKKLKLFLGVLLASFCITVKISDVNAEEVIISNKGEETLVEDITEAVEEVETSEPYVPSEFRRSSPAERIYIEDFGYPMTPEGLDFSFDTVPKDEDLELFNPESRVVRYNRSIVSNPNAFPYRASVLILSDFRTKSGTMVRGSGSGSLIGPNKVATVAHNLYHKEYGWAETVRVYPAVKYNYTDYGMAYGSTLYTYGGYISAATGSLKAQQRDVGVIKLNSNLGNTTGWYGYSTGRSSQHRLNGYDGDMADGRTLITRGGSDTYQENGLVKYPWRTTSGSSSGGVYNPSTNILESLHGYGYFKPNSTVQIAGGGAKINNSVYDFLHRY